MKEIESTEDKKGVTRSHKSNQHRQHNSKEKKNNRTNNYLQNTTRKNHFKIDILGLSKFAQKTNARKHYFGLFKAAHTMDVKH